MHVLSLLFRSLKTSIASYGIKGPVLVLTCGRSRLVDPSCRAPPWLLGKDKHLACLRFLRQVSHHHATWEKRKKTDITKNSLQFSPTSTALRLHFLDDPVVGHHLDVNTLLVVVDGPALELLHLHQTTIGRDLRLTQMEQVRT